MKRKKSITAKKMIVFLLIALLTVVFVYSKVVKTTNTPNSFRSSGYLGNSLYLDTLKKLGYQVKYDIRPIERINTNELVVLNAATFGDLTEEDYNKIFEYVENGGKMLVLFLNPDSTTVIEPKQLVKKFPNETGSEPFRKWVFESEGVLMYGNIFTLSNTSVSLEREIAYQTLEMLHPYIDDERIVFNEYYLFKQIGKRSLWKEMPEGMRFVIYQILVMLLLIIWMKGKRFGAPAKLYEEVEPDEHAYAKAVGELYYQAGHWETLLNSYYLDFIAKMQQKHLLYGDVREDNWLNIFEIQHPKDLKAAKKVYSFIQSYQAGDFEKVSKRVLKKKVKEMLISIQNLEKNLENR